MLNDYRDTVTQKDILLYSYDNGDKKKNMKCDRSVHSYSFPFSPHFVKTHPELHT